jgi:hypothetical protein
MAFKVVHANTPQLPSENTPSIALHVQTVSLPRRMQDLIRDRSLVPLLFDIE